MNYGIIDADLLDGGTRFPNLALMKISSFYKSQHNKISFLFTHYHLYYTNNNYYYYECK